MPIPPALAARLAKRGILAGKKISKEPPQEPPEEKTYEDQNEEEVIAEDYDDQGDIDSNHKNNSGTHDLFIIDDKIEEEYSYKKFRGYSGCPNKTNIYHTCTKFCEEHWKSGHSEPDAIYLEKKASMLAKYPLPVHWQEVYDPGVGRHYYWEVDSDSVSWLPPSHPRSEVSRPAAYSRQQLQKVKTKEKDTSNQENLEIDDMEDSNSEEESDYSEEEIERSRERDSKKRKLEQEKLRARGRVKLKENNLDPMDPAAYSDVPRGGWSEGLSKGNEAKTGADVTAAGPLYQMRPYPNPGAVLRANAEARKHSPPPKESRSKDKSSH